MSDDFKLGQEVQALYFKDGSECIAGQLGVEKITVVMENGQMAGVPWFAVWENGKVTNKWNGANLEGVRT